MNQRFKAVRTDRELECREIDEGLRATGGVLTTLPEGLGKIGRSMARMASGFRMRVIGYSPHTPDETFRSAEVECCADLGELMAVSDVVSIHAVLNAETRHLIGARELSRMKPSAFLIN